jgi:uncharacterized membrane protein YgcG
MSTATLRSGLTFRIGAAAVVALAFLLTIPPTVLAASPHPLTRPVTDDVGVLREKGLVNDTLNFLKQTSGAQLWIWITDTLEGRPSHDFAAATADATALGPTDLLIVIAINDQGYDYWKGDMVRISDADLERILSRDMAPSLRSRDYFKAIMTATAGLNGVMTGAVKLEPTASPGAATGSTDGLPVGTLAPWMVVVGFLILGLFVAVAWLVLRARRRERGGA